MSIYSQRYYLKIQTPTERRRYIERHLARSPERNVDCKRINIKYEYNVLMPQHYHTELTWDDTEDQKGFDIAIC